MLTTVSCLIFFLKKSCIHQNMVYLFQVCPIIVGSWSHPSKYLNITTSLPAATIESTVHNNEWDIIDIRVSCFRTIVYHFVWLHNLHKLKNTCSTISKFMSKSTIFYRSNPLHKVEWWWSKDLNLYLAGWPYNFILKLKRIKTSYHDLFFNFYCLFWKILNIL